MWKKTIALVITLLAGIHTHPGTTLELERDAHIFISGAEVNFPSPPELAAPVTAVRVLDEHLTLLDTRSVDGSSVSLGVLSPGWYRVEFVGGDGALLGFTTAAVLEGGVPEAFRESPVALDVALAWLGARDQSNWPLLSELARQAGAGWVRDRIHWREMQEASGAFLPDTKYDTSARIQHEAGLSVLQVFHTRPNWAVLEPANPGGRGRIDLLKLYTFCREMATRFRGRVQAWEPWNEGNAANFGGYTLDELATIQKVAWLGFKAGDPTLTVCWNPLGGINRATQVEDLLRNETWPYFDIYSIHSYDWPHDFEKLWADARNGASGRPIWVTEGDRGMTVDPESTVGDFTPEMDRRMAEFIPQSYVRSLFSGAERHFHFILGHYTEGEGRTQFGLLRADHTPRPGYVALATLGRMLDGGRCLGRYEVPERPDVHVYAFHARPGGEPKDVLVAWCEGEFDWPERGRRTAPWPIASPFDVERATDYLGRPLDARAPTQLSGAPVYLVLQEGASAGLQLRSVEKGPERGGEATPVVLQFGADDVEPVVRTVGWTQEGNYEFTPGDEVRGTLSTYNLGTEAVEGRVTLTIERGAESMMVKEMPVTIGAMSRVDQSIVFSMPEGLEDGWITFRGDFGTSGKPVLSIRNRQKPLAQ
jgi:hypothetical protein